MMHQMLCVIASREWQLYVSLIMSGYQELT